MTSREQSCHKNTLERTRETVLKTCAECCNPVRKAHCSLKFGYRTGPLKVLNDP